MQYIDGFRPSRATFGSAGYDFRIPETVFLVPGEWITIDTGVAFDDSDYIDMQVPFWFMMLVPRSSLGTKFGFRLRNTVGIIDSDYRDTIKATVAVDEPLTLTKGDKFLQGIVIPFARFNGEERPTASRTGGYGSTGRR